MHTMNEIKFYEGEKREINAIIRSKNPNEIVVVTSSTFELKKKCDGEDETVQTGTCETAGSEITIFLDCSIGKGTYILTITSVIGRETVIDKIKVKIED